MNFLPRFRPPSPNIPARSAAISKRWKPHDFPLLSERVEGRVRWRLLDGFRNVPSTGPLAHGIDGAGLHQAVGGAPGRDGDQGRAGFGASESDRTHPSVGHAAGPATRGHIFCRHRATQTLSSSSRDHRSAHPCHYRQDDRPDAVRLCLTRDASPGAKSIRTGSGMRPAACTSSAIAICAGSHGCLPSNASSP